MSLNFNGVNQYVALSDNAIFNTNRITMAAWVNPLALGNTLRVICSTNSVIAGYRAPFALFFNNGRLSAQVAYQNNFLILASYEAAQTSSPNPVVQGKWLHVAMTYDGSAIRLYENGQQTQVSVINRIALSGVTATLGADRTAPNSFQGYFSGVIEDFRMFDRTLSGNEILTISTLRGKDNILLNNVVHMMLNDMPVNKTLPMGKTMTNLTKNAIMGYANNNPTFSDSFVNLLKRW